MSTYWLSLQKQVRDPKANVQAHKMCKGKGRHRQEGDNKLIHPQKLQQQCMRGLRGRAAVQGACKGQNTAS